MPYNFGSSSININPSVGPGGPPGPTSGITGNTGPTGNKGNTGDGLTGATGVGVTVIGIIGTTLGITYGTGNTLFSISNNEIQGPTGTTASNTALYAIKGITTTGFSVLKTNNATEFAANSITYDSKIKNIVEFRNLVFSGITYTDSNTITLTGISSSVVVNTIKENQLIYIDTNNLIAGVTTSFWNSNTRTLTYMPPVFVEVNTINYGVTGDNYRNSFVGLTEIPATGCNVLYNLVRPLTKIQATGITSALYIDGISGSITTTGVILEFNGSSGSYGFTFGPQYAAGITYGSCCLPSGKCIEYSTKQYCDTFSGSTFSAGISCEASKCGFKSCCLYDIETDGFTCINAHPTECAAFLGVTGTDMCRVNTCASSALCCVPTTQYTTQSTQLNNSDFNEQYSIPRSGLDGRFFYIKTTNSTNTNYVAKYSEAIFLGYVEPGDVGRCLIPGDCLNTTLTGCDDLRGSFTPRITCNSNESGAPDDAPLGYIS